MYIWRLAGFVAWIWLLDATLNVGPVTSVLFLIVGTALFASGDRLPERRAVGSMLLLWCVGWLDASADLLAMLVGLTWIMLSTHQRVLGLADVPNRRPAGKRRRPLSPWISYAVALRPPIPRVLTLAELVLGALGLGVGLLYDAGQRRETATGPVADLWRWVDVAGESSPVAWVVVGFFAATIMTVSFYTLWTFLAGRRFHLVYLRPFSEDASWIGKVWVTPMLGAYGRVHVVTNSSFAKPSNLAAWGADAVLRGTHLYSFSNDTWPDAVESLVESTDAVAIDISDPVRAGLLLELELALRTLPESRIVLLCRNRRTWHLSARAAVAHVAGEKFGRLHEPLYYGEYWHFQSALRRRMANLDGDPPPQAGPPPTDEVAQLLADAQAKMSAVLVDLIRDSRDIAADDSQTTGEVESPDGATEQGDAAEANPGCSWGLAIPLGLVLSYFWSPANVVWAGLGVLVASVVAFPLPNRRLLAGPCLMVAAGLYAWASAEHTLGFPGSGVPEWLQSQWSFFGMALGSTIAAGQLKPARAPGDASVDQIAVVLVGASVARLVTLATGATASGPLWGAALLALLVGRAATLMAAIAFCVGATLGVGLGYPYLAALAAALASRRYIGVPDLSGKVPVDER